MYFFSDETPNAISKFLNRKMAGGYSVNLII